MIQKIRNFIFQGMYSFLKMNIFLKISEGKYCDHNSSNEFILPCDTNLEWRKICVENHIHVGDQGNEDNMAPQEEAGIEEHEDEEEENQRDEVPIWWSSRQTRPSSRLKDFVTYPVQYPIQNYISHDNITNDHYVFLNTLSQSEEPKVFEIAKLDPKWCKAMDEELDALEKKTKHEKYACYQKNKKSVGCKWIYKIKYHSDGTIEWYKTRLVTKGYTQTYGIDYYETFTSVAKMNTVRILLSIAVNNGWIFFQMDVKNIFLQGTLEEEVYMNLSPGHRKENIPNLVCRLKKIDLWIKAISTSMVWQT
jgi:Reverse transcriptase (RNA-dependent DNA polymerase)